MTTRFSGFQVTLAEDVRDDDAEAIINALKMVKGVVDVQPIKSDLMSPETCRYKRKIRDRFYEFLKSLE